MSEITQSEVVERNIAVRIGLEHSICSLKDTRQKIDDLLKTYTNTSILILIADIQSIPYVGVKYHLDSPDAQILANQRLKELKECLLPHLLSIQNSTIEVAYWHEIVDKAYNEKMSLSTSTYQMMRDFHAAITEVVKEMFSEKLKPEEVDAIAPQILGEILCLLHGIHFHGKVYELVETKESLQNLAGLIRRGKAWPWILQGSLLSEEEIGK